MVEILGTPRQDKIKSGSIIRMSQQLFIVYLIENNELKLVGVFDSYQLANVGRSFSDLYSKSEAMVKKCTLNVFLNECNYTNDWPERVNKFPEFYF